MKCLIIDAVSSEIAEVLGKDMEVVTSATLPPSKDELKAQIGDVDGLIMRVDPMIDKEVLDAAKNLKVIGVCSVGLNHKRSPRPREDIPSNSLSVALLEVNSNAPY